MRRLGEVEVCDHAQKGPSGMVMHRLFAPTYLGKDPSRRTSKLDKVAKRARVVGDVYVGIVVRLCRCSAYITVSIQRNNTPLILKIQSSIRHVSEVP